MANSRMAAREARIKNAMKDNVVNQKSLAKARKILKPGSGATKNQKVWAKSMVRKAFEQGSDLGHDYGPQLRWAGDAYRNGTPSWRADKILHDPEQSSGLVISWVMLDILGYKANYKVWPTDNYVWSKVRRFNPEALVARELHTSDYLFRAGSRWLKERDRWAKAHGDRTPEQALPPTEADRVERQLWNKGVLKKAREFVERVKTTHCKPSSIHWEPLASGATTNPWAAPGTMLAMGGYDRYQEVTNRGGLSTHTDFETVALVRPVSNNADGLSPARLRSAVDNIADLVPPSEFDKISDERLQALGLPVAEVRAATSSDPWVRLLRGQKGLVAYVQKGGDPVGTLAKAGLARGLVTSALAYQRVRIAHPTADPALCWTMAGGADRAWGLDHVTAVLDRFVGVYVRAGRQGSRDPWMRLLGQKKLVKMVKKSGDPVATLVKAGLPEQVVKAGLAFEKARIRRPASDPLQCWSGTIWSLGQVLNAFDRFSALWVRANRSELVKEAA